MTLRYHLIPAVADSGIGGATSFACLERILETAWAGLNDGVAGMRCRHTVPDWQQYVVSVTDTPPIFAACRLLLREGERASDSRAIACSYWRHQVDCPVYDGPEARTDGSTGAQHLSNRPVAPADVPLAGEEPWPVRAPGATDGMRRIVIGLGLFSVALLVWTGVVGLSVIRGTATPGRFLTVSMAAAAVSIGTHILTTLRAWAGR